MSKNRNGGSPPTVADNPARSILASVGIRPDRIGRPGYCTLCGRGPNDGAVFDPTLGDGIELATDLVCEFCRFRQAATQFGGPLLEGIRRARMRVFSDGWRRITESRDGAAFVHDLRKLRVIEDVALNHDAEPDAQPRGAIAGLPVVERTEFGSVVIVRTFDGSQEVHRERVVAVDPVDGGPRVRNDSAVPAWPDSVVHAVWKWNAAHGWRWWHHVSVSHKDRLPTYDELAIVRREFVTTMRECYQIFPPEDRFVNLHPRVLHLWHCVDGQTLDADTGRVLPQFEAELSGQQGRMNGATAGARSRTSSTVV